MAEKFSVMMPLEPLFPVEVDNIVVVLVQLISLFPIWLHTPTRSVCALNAPILYDLSHRSRMGKISVIQVPNLNPSLVHTYLATTLRGEVDRDSCIRVWRVEESLCHRLFM